LNYLQMEQAIFVPVFDRAEDENVLKILEKVFQGQKIIPVISNEIGIHGGGLNCITWNLKG